MSYAPASIKEAQVYLKEVTGLPWASLGIVADGYGDSYHRGADRLGSRRSYSVGESSRDRNGLSNASSALDIGNFSVTYQGRGVSLRSLSLWLVEQCKAGASETKDIRSIIYTPDGKVVRRWDRLGVRSSGDDSHLTHTHISWFRDSEHRNKVDLFRRYFEGDDDVSWNESLDAQKWAVDGGYYEGVSSLPGKSAAWHLTNAAGHVRALRIKNIPEILAGQAAILARFDGADDDTTRQIIADELAKAAEAERTERQAEYEALVPQLARAIGEQVDHDLDTAAVEAALRSVLGSVDNPA